MPIGSKALGETGDVEGGEDLLDRVGKLGSDTVSGDQGDLREQDERDVRG